jgi:serine/threonine-protein kinase HipA
LRVPRTEFHLYGESPATPYLRVERYDRARDAAGRRRRLHQEDIAQALGYATTEKYEDDGGPLLRRVTEDPVADIARLRDWQLFNYLIGNADAHAKNIALLYPESGAVPQLAPFYDLVAVEFLNRLGMHFDRNMAFFVGEQHVPEQVTKHDWIQLAKSIGVPAGSLLDRLRNFAEALPDIARATRTDFAAEFADNYDKLEESIADRCRLVVRSVFGRG